jgi:hypothetical protein
LTQLCESDLAKPNTEDDRGARWEFVRNRDGRATNVRCLRGTTIIEVLHRGEKILVDVTEMKAIDLNK